MYPMPSRKQRSILARNTSHHRQSRNRFYLKEKYTSKRPTSWMLQEIAARSLTNNIEIISEHQKGDSGERSIFADKVSRNVPIKTDNVLQRAPNWEGPKFWLTNLRDKSVNELLTILSLKGRKRLDKALPSKGGFFLRRLRLKNRTHRKGEGGEGSGQWKSV